VEAKRQARSTCCDHLDQGANAPSWCIPRSLSCDPSDHELYVYTALYAHTPPLHPLHPLHPTPYISVEGTTSSAPRQAVYRRPRCHQTLRKKRDIGVVGVGWSVDRRQGWRGSGGGYPPSGGGSPPCRLDLARFLLVIARLLWRGVSHPVAPSPWPSRRLARLVPAPPCTTMVHVSVVSPLRSDDVSGISVAPRP
jgi:hypothetical protein